MATRRRAPRRTIAALAAIAVALAGCGSSSDDEPDRNSPEAALERKIDALEKKIKAAPRDPEPLADLAKARFQAAGLKTNDIGEFGDEGKDELRRATEAWKRYVALDPEPPDTGVAQLMVAAYGPGSLDEPKKAVEIQRVIAEKTRPPSAAAYAQLAQMAYYAGDRRTAESAADRAIELTPKSGREAMRKTLATARSQQP